MSSREEIFKPAAEPQTKLGYRRILSPNAGIRVSPLCLGGMSLGAAWSGFTGKISKEEAFALLDAFAEAGGNFIDIANLYHFGDSERWIGEWMEARNNRDQMVIATKYTGYNDGDRKDPNSAGNHTKSLRLTVRDSCKRLRTDYIDILYLHVWDYTTSVEEIMRAMHQEILAGRIIYPAISDTPAWVVVKANAYARANSMSPFVLYQGRWNVIFRDMERELVPMCRSEGMAIAPWGAIGQGQFQSKAQIDAREKAGEKLRGQRNDTDIKISEALEKVAGEVGNGATVTSVALAWIMQKTPYVFPIIGGRKIEHLHDNIKALSISLSDAQIKELESVVPFEPGFPLTMIQQDPHWVGGGGNMMLSTTAKFQFVQDMVPIKPE